MTNKEYRKNAYVILYLINCVLNDRIPSKRKIESIDLSHLYIVAKEHMLSAITAYALELVGIVDDHFVEAKAKAIQKTILFDYERDKVLKKLNEFGIWYLPLKGIVLKEYYPIIGLREMCDNDILYDKIRSSEIRKIMSNQGFSSSNTNTGHDIVFHKNPIFNFEMHYALFSESADNTFCNYYKNIFLKLHKVDEKKSEYRFSNEDFYIYITAHEYKHFSSCGTGIRSLVDAYVFLNRYNNCLNMEYIEQELEKLGIKEYENKRQQLVIDIFDRGRINSEQKRLLDYYIFSGTYGKVENRVRNTTDKSFFSKLRYIKDRLFLPKTAIKNSYPFFYSHKYLLPLLSLYRLYLMLIKNRKNVLSEIKALLKA